jgi:hypothetical protein
VAGGLYNSTSSSSQASNAIQTTLSNTGINFDGINLDSFVIGAHFFVLSLCLFNTVLLLTDFFIRYFKMAPNDDFLKYHLDGKKSFFRAWNTWATYIPLLVLFGLYAYFSKVAIWGVVLGIVYLVACLFKIIIEYGKTPIGKVLNGEDNSIIGRFFKTAKDITKSSDAKGGKGGDTIMSVSGGILGEFANQVGGLGSEALRQTTGVSVQSAPTEKKK